MKNMKTMRWILPTTVAATVAALSASALADDSTSTFRTLSYGVGVYQGTNGAAKPVYAYQPIAGHDLVAAALGQPLGTVLTNQVLALQIDCDSSTASLVVFDKPSSNIIATIAASTSVNVVRQQDKDITPFPNRERFVAQFAVAQTNHLAGGFLTVAGRLQLDPTNGCPRAIRVKADPLDGAFGDTDGANHDDLENHDIFRAGVGHAVGVIGLVFNDGTTNTVLFPEVRLSFRRSLD